MSKEVREETSELQVEPGKPLTEVSREGEPIKTGESL